MSAAKTCIAHLDEADGTPLPDEEEKDCGSLLRSRGFLPADKTALNTTLGAETAMLR
jgi:hypothetical protein